MRGPLAVADRQSVGCSLVAHSSEAHAQLSKARNGDLGMELWNWQELKRDDVFTYKSWPRKLSSSFSISNTSSERWKYCKVRSPDIYSCSQWQLCNLIMTCWFSHSSNNIIVVTHFKTLYTYHELSFTTTTTSTNCSNLHHPWNSIITYPVNLLDLFHHDWVGLWCQFRERAESTFKPVDNVSVDPSRLREKNRRLMT